jgi:hypothetical protein
MGNFVISKKELKTAVREGVREALDQELMKWYAVLLPFVSEKEQRDIERLYGKPSRRVARSRRLEL